MGKEEPSGGWLPVCRSHHPIPDLVLDVQLQRCPNQALGNLNLSGSSGIILICLFVLCWSNGCAMSHLAVAMLYPAWAGSTLMHAVKPDWA